MIKTTRKLGDCLAVLLCKKTCVLLHVSGEILEKAPPTPSGRAPHYSHLAGYPQVAPSGGTPCKASGSFVLLSLKCLLCTSPATGCKPEAEGMEMHRAESFSLLSRKRQGKRAHCFTVLYGLLEAARALHCARIPKGEQEGLALRARPHLDLLTWVTDGP